MRIIDLFTGIGGFLLAAQIVFGKELEIVQAVEIEEFCQERLRKNFKGINIYGNIKTFKADKFKPIDILCGGFPCQPYSNAGKRKGKNDDRSLWEEMLRVIKESKPTWILCENVPGIINLALDQVLLDLEAANYTVETFNLPIVGFDFDHVRQRIFILAYSNSFRFDKIERFHKRSYFEAQKKLRKERKKVRIQLSRDGYLQFQRTDKSRICGGNDGLSKRMDRIKALGNAVSPEMVIPFFQFIKLASEVENVS